MAFNLEGKIDGKEFSKNGTRCMLPFPFRTSMVAGSKVKFFGCSTWANSTYDWPHKQTVPRPSPPLRPPTGGSGGTTIWTTITGIINGNSTKDDGKEVSTEDVFNTVLKWGQQQWSDSAITMKAGMAAATASLAVASSIC